MKYIFPTISFQFSNIRTYSILHNLLQTIHYPIIFERILYLHNKRTPVGKPHDRTFSEFMLVFDQSVILNSSQRKSSQKKYINYLSIGFLLVNVHECFLSLRQISTLAKLQFTSSLSWALRVVYKNCFISCSG